MIETQQLIKSVIDGVVVVDDEETYNNMSRAMTYMNGKLFLKSHLSTNTEQNQFAVCLKKLAAALTF